MPRCLRRFWWSVAAASILMLKGLSSCVTAPAGDLSDLPSPLQKAWVEISKADVLLIGELHDSPHHHRLQGQILAALAQEKRLGAVLFEQMDSSQAPLLQNLTPKDLDRLPSLLKWSQSGWPDFELYRPVFAAALNARVPLIAANLPPATTRQIYQKGIQSLFSPDQSRAVGLNTTLPQAAMAALRDEIFDGHCKMIPREQVDKMIPIQRARDAAMALAWRQAPHSGVAVYIVGNGHARKDFGIPWYLKQESPQTKVFSIGLVEEGASDPGRDAFYDLTLMTPPTKRDDPCQDLARTLKKPAGAPKAPRQD